MRVETNSAPPGLSSCASVPSIAAGSGTCSSISMQVTTSKPAGLARASSSARRQAVVDREPLGYGVQARDLDHGGGQIDGRHPRALARETLRQQAPAAADIQHAHSGERHAFADEARAHRVQQVQRPKLALRVPEAARAGVEFGQFRGIGVGRAGQPARSCGGSELQARSPGGGHGGELLGIEGDEAVGTDGGPAAAPHITHLRARRAKDDRFLQARVAGHGQRIEFDAQ